MEITVLHVDQTVLPTSSFLPKMHSNVQIANLINSKTTKALHTPTSTSGASDYRPGGQIQPARHEARHI